VEWVPTIVCVEKEDCEKLWVRDDFRDINRATPKDEYPMTRADMLINDVLGHRVISFLDGNASYNQIFMAEVDASKTTFIFPGFIGLFEFFYDFWFEEQRGIPSAESSRSVRGLGKGVSVASLTLAYAMRVDYDSYLGPSGP
jgi:hypothetical protein